MWTTQTVVINQRTGANRTNTGTCNRMVSKNANTIHRIRTHNNINQLRGNEFNPNEDNEKGEGGTIPDDLAPNTTNDSTTSSAFLEE